MLTRSTVRHDLATGTLVELPVADLPRWEITLALAYRSENSDTQPIRALRTPPISRSEPAVAASRDQSCGVRMVSRAARACR